MDDYPENTAAAFRSSGPEADVVECDVRRCGSGELVVFHDATLDRVTGRSGRIGLTDWSDLRELRVHGSDEPIPRLPEVFDAVPGDTTVTLELKSRGIAASVVDYAVQVDHDVIVSSFDYSELRAANDAGASTLAVLCHENPQAALDVVQELDAEYVHPSRELCIDTDLVERAHDRGVEVDVWIGESRPGVGELRTTDIDELRAADVDGINTNRVDLLGYISRVPTPGDRSVTPQHGPDGMVNDHATRSRSFPHRTEPTRLSTNLASDSNAKNTTRLRAVEPRPRSPSDPG